MTRRSRVPGTYKRTLYVLPSIPDDLDEETKNALAIRNAASTNGRCPDCGVEAELHRDPESELLFHAVFEHEPTCRSLTDGAA